MKILLLTLGLLSFVSCKQKTKNQTIIKIEQENRTDTLVSIKEKIEDSLNITDFLLLRKKSIQRDFFKKIDSTFAIQFPTNEDKKRSLNITPKMLNIYLNDISEVDFKDSISIVENTFAKRTYRFKLVPKEIEKIYKTSDYKTIFQLNYFPNDGYRFVIMISYFIHFEEDDDNEVEKGVMEEHMILYYFKIINGKIVDFGRNEAG